MTIIERNKIVEDMAAALGLRTYQTECAKKVVTCFIEAYSTEFLISACCRYGKTTTALSICKIMQAVLNMDDMIITVISGMPGSVKSSWRDDAYRLGLINNRETSELDVDQLDFTKTTGTDLVFISTQKLGDNTDKDGNKKAHTFIKEYKDFVNNHAGLKLCIKDEAHNAFGTNRALDALADFNFDYTLDLTATPYTVELINKYRLDATSGDKVSYFFSQLDMLELYNSANEIILADGTVAKEGFTCTDKVTGLEKAWRPVQPVVIIEDIYSKLLSEGFDFDSQSEELNQTAFVSAYFKTIFENTQAYKKYCDIFVQTYIIDFAAKYHITNILAFDTTNAFANKVAAYINQNFGAQIYAKSLADEKLSTDETSTDKANEVFAKKDGKIHFVITCRKCGTGSSMPLLDATMFLKGVVSYIEWCQFAARAFNPSDNKTYGYVVMFSPIEALQMITQHANSEKHHKKPDDDEDEDDEALNINEYLQYIKVYLDGTELHDATEIMTKLDTVYNPSQTILFPSLNLMAEDVLSELTSLVIRDAKFNPRTPQEPKQPSQNDNDDPDSHNTNQPRPTNNSNASEYTKESLAKSFQLHFVELIKDLYQDDFTEEDIRAIDDTSDERTKRFITKTLCSMALWNKLNKEYFDKILHKVYVYATKVVVK